MKKPKLKIAIFDMDGVITKTSLIHSLAWKKTFDEYLRLREERYCEPFREFTHMYDYLPYVDGKPRLDGVRSFLESRNIFIPEGEEKDLLDNETIWGVANRKNDYFFEIVNRDGVQLYSSTIQLIMRLKDEGVKVAIATSSKNCDLILERTGLLDLFDTKIDGMISQEMGLNGKPHPDIFQQACKNLKIPYDMAVVFEDAVSGVTAARDGNMGLVVGVARENNSHELQVNGADIVVSDIREISYEQLVEWFTDGMEKDSWKIEYHSYDRELERTRETLCAIGNGYIGSRANFEEVEPGQFNYPGSYIAGVFNRLTSEVSGREIVNEDFVNCPNWTAVNFRCNHEAWVDLNNTRILSFKRELDLKSALYHRSVVIEDAEGRQTEITSVRFASMDNPHLLCLRYIIKPLNYSEFIEVRTGLVGNIINAGVERYRQLNSSHLETKDRGLDGKLSWLLTETNQSKIEIGMAQKLELTVDENSINPEIEFKGHDGNVWSEFSLLLQQNQELVVEKTVSVYTSLDKSVSDGMALEWAKRGALGAHPIEKLLHEHKHRWNEMWNKMDVEVAGDRYTQKLLRLHIYHLASMASIHNKDIDAGLPARGLNGEAYRGHIFWDELFMFPFYNMHFPQIAKSAVLYRYRRLNKAREYAKEFGFKGAMFPWQSGSDGREETQVIHLNPLSGEWGPDYSCYQRHISLAIAYNIWHYYHLSEDVAFLENYGAEIFLEICRFWAQKAKFNESLRQYEIHNVMGPDEYHEKYPDSNEGGLSNNSYTNIMVAWILRRGFNILKVIKEESVQAISEKIRLTENELMLWKEVSKALRIHISDEDIIEQFEGYFDLEELDWDHYRETYGNIKRMDRILKSEGKSADHYKVAKQADVLQSFYNLSETELKQLLNKLGYYPSYNFFFKNFDYYLHRSSHGSTLSKIVHAHLSASMGEPDESWNLYSQALESDFKDSQGGTTQEGIHAGVMAATVMLAIGAYGGLITKDDYLAIHPYMPVHWRKIKFNCDYKGHRYYFTITHELLQLKVEGPNPQVKVKIEGKDFEIATGKEHSYFLKRIKRY